MSKVGKAKIEILSGVSVSQADGNVTISGPKGTIEIQIPAGLTIEIVENELTVKRADDSESQKAMHGTFRMAIANAVKGVKDGFEKKLEIHGVGYRAKLVGLDLSLSVGYTHPIVITPPEGVTIEVPDEVTVIVKGYSKHAVGQTAAKIRDVRRAEPYKGKGLRYEGEYVRRKSSKSTKA